MKGKKVINFLRNNYFLNQETLPYNHLQNFNHMKSNKINEKAEQ